MSLLGSLRRRAAIVLLSSALFLSAACSVESGAPPTPSGARPTSSPDSPQVISEGSSFELVTIGDFGDGSETEKEVAASVRAWAEEHSVDALLTTGDNVYPHGEAEDFTETWVEPYGWVEEQGLSIVASLGNHDVESDGGAAVMNLLGMPSRWYSRLVGDAEIFVLDANVPQDPAQLGWLQQALESSSAKWKIVVFHHAAYSCSEHDGTPLVQQLWVPLFERFEVDLVLNGHDHVYQRFEPEEGPTYIVTGGGGNALYGLDECPDSYPPRVAGNSEEHHFVSVSGTPGALVVKAVTPSGSIIDSFTINQ
jgi:3',5'-cyclic AMP phosphodiesterase CpdA